MKFSSVKEIKQYAEETGSFFFSPGNIRFFNSRFGRSVYGDNGDVFITSEQFEYLSSSRLYSVRRIFETGDIETVGEFQQFATRQEAVAFALDYVRSKEYASDLPQYAN